MYEYELSLKVCSESVHVYSYLWIRWALVLILVILMSIDIQEYTIVATKLIIRQPQ